MTPQASSNATESTQLSEVPSADLRSLSATAPELRAAQAGEPAPSIAEQVEASRNLRYRIISLATYQIYQSWE